MTVSYVNTLGLSWPDYLKVNADLQLEGTIDNLRYDIATSNRELIATNKQLQKEQISVTKKNTATIKAGFEQLSIGLHTLNTSINELQATFEWGFSELLASVGLINDSLKELIKIAKTPAQTWAYEQFEIARDAYRQGLYEDSLEYLARSIDGYGDNTGYKLEYRFHYLLGTIHLGSFKNNSSSIVNLDKAKNAFLSAAKYSKHDQPNESGRALLAAGWVSYCQGEIPEAKNLTEQAISLYPELGEAHFQLAKVLMHSNNPESAINHLRDAIEIDRNYVIKASSDDDFIPHNEYVLRLINTVRKEKEKEFKNKLDDIGNKIDFFQSWEIQEYSPKKHVDFKNLHAMRDESESSGKTNTLFGFMNSLSLLEKSKRQLNQVVSQYKESTLSELNYKRNRVNNIGNKKKISESLDFENGFVGLGYVVACIILSIILATVVTNSIIGFFGWFALFYMLMAWILPYVVSQIRYYSKRSNSTSESMRLDNIKKNIIELTSDFMKSMS